MASQVDNYMLTYRHENGNPILSEGSNLLCVGKTMTFDVQRADGNGTEAVCCAVNRNVFEGTYDEGTLCGTFAVVGKKMECPDLRRKSGTDFNPDDTGSFTGIRHF